MGFATNILILTEGNKTVNKISVIVLSNEKKTQYFAFKAAQKKFVRVFDIQRNETGVHS
jgi:hypothetical protein